MSTVVLNSTHIASDHSLVHKTYPPENKIDMDHRKLFISPDKTFIIGTVGEFIPSQIDTTKTYDAVRFLLDNMVASQALGGLVSETALLPRGPELDHYTNVFDTNGHTLIVTKHERFLIFKGDPIDNAERWYARRAGGITGIGSGGFIATGLLMGGLPLTDIWEPLHHLDCHSSTEHTIIPLSILKTDKHLARVVKILKDGQP